MSDGVPRAASSYRGQEGLHPSQMKKLVYIANYIDERDVQHFVHLVNLLTELQAHGWSVLLLSERGGRGIKRVMGHEVRYLSKQSRLLRLGALVMALIAARRQGYRLVFVRISKMPALISGALGALIGLKTLYWQSGTNRDLDLAQPFVARVVERIRMRALIELVCKFVTGPETMLRYYKREYSVPSDKLLLLYNDIDTARFHPAGLEADRDNAIRVLFVHSFSPSKQATKYLPAIIEQLNRAASPDRPIRFDLAGDGPERRLIEKMVGEACANLTVRLLGAVPNADLPELYRAADIFVMPSYREGMPRALMEAMASGLAAVSTDAGGVIDLVGPQQAAFVVSRDEPEKFGQRLYDLVLDDETRRALQRENRAQIARFSTAAVARMYDDALGQLL